MVNSNSQAKRKFVTLFPNCPNIGLVKDVGQIPYHIGMYKEFEGILASQRIDLNGPFIDDVVGLHIDKISGLIKSETLAGVLYLVKHSKNIDILNLYHCRKQTYYFAWIYKLLNPSGRVYLKLDAGNKTIEELLRNKKYRSLLCRLTNTVDIVSSESLSAQKKFIEICGKMIEYVPNGVNCQDICLKEKRENRFLTVGRIGANEKNNDILLQAFAKIADHTDWNLMLVGKVESEFLEYKDQFFKDHPDLKDRVFFTGEVTNRNKLMDIYRKSKVFVLPSKYESFSIACVEALVNGCYLILSDQVTPKMDFTNNWEYGTEARVNDADDLSEKMLAASKQFTGKDKGEEIAEYGKKYFSWNDVCGRLHTLLMGDKNQE